MGGVEGMAAGVEELLPAIHQHAGVVGEGREYLEKGHVDHRVAYYC